MMQMQRPKWLIILPKVAFLYCEGISSRLQAQVARVASFRRKGEREIFGKEFQNEHEVLAPVLLLGVLTDLGRGWVGGFGGRGWGAGQE